MRIAFILYKYFSFGGLARDLLRIAEVCLQKGHSIDVYTMEWHGEDVPGINKHVLGAQGWSNHAKVADFHKKLKLQLGCQHFDVIMGFNKVPGLDVYYAADPCYVDRFVDKTELSRNGLSSALMKLKSFGYKNLLYRLNPRYRFYAEMERAVFGRNSHTVCLMISDVQSTLYVRHYGIPEDRLIALKPGIDPSRRRTGDAEHRRHLFRQQHCLSDDDLLVLMVGTGFKTKGVDRALSSISSLPTELKNRVRLMVVGEDSLDAYRRLAVEKGIQDNTCFMGGRSDVPEFLLGADLLLHPARKENTGTVILEAIVAGLPVLVTDVCGYAKYVHKAAAGKVLPSPFEQNQLDYEFADMLKNLTTNVWKQNALAFAETADLYSMPEMVTAIIENIAKDKQDAL